jgi:hypothetical protein
MYNTDLKYRKGMYLAYIEGQTNWFFRHTDPGFFHGGIKKYMDKHHPNQTYNTTMMPFHDVDWIAAGYPDMIININQI